jgi:hypothetical protein
MSGHYAGFQRSNLLYVTTDEGVYELFADDTVFLGCSEADPRGVRGRLEKHFTGEILPGADIVKDFRIEINGRPRRKLEELLDEFEHEHGYLPRFNVPAEPVSAGS